jgi:hypothetical protein
MALSCSMTSGNPIFNGDAGVKGLETIVALSKHAN